MGWWDASVCAAAARYGCLESLQYAHTHGCPWDARVCLYAAEEGDLGVLRYAHEHGCPWGSPGEVCIRAVRGGHLGILKYAHTNGCPMSEAVWVYATITRDYDIMSYLQANNFPCPSPPTKPRAKEVELAFHPPDFKQSPRHHVPVFSDPIIY